MEEFDYFSLIRNSDNKEVYTSPCYTLDESNVIDFRKVGRTLKFYFDRVNGGIQQQLESPKLSDEQKKELKLLNADDYSVALKKFVPVGIAEKIYWKRPAGIYIN